MDGPSRSSSRQRLPSRPTTPLRPSSRSSVREAHGYGASIGNVGYNQPAINALEPLFAELSDAMVDLDTNFAHLQLMHESLTRFSESFASFLYGLNMNAFCVDFPEAPIAESFRRAKQTEMQEAMDSPATGPEEDEANTSEPDVSIMTTDTTFVEHPPSTVSSKPTLRVGSTRGSAGRGRGSSSRGSTTSRYATRGRARPSALPRGRSMR
ncbi:DASH complex subunit DAM1 [Aspergillus undulatus]|uniref:DASH complex subunit DAM1 n=1 Tax=Aspergillus undulatus TaxID=1810928 RepID=UPI003CCCC63B